MGEDRLTKNIQDENVNKVGMRSIGVAGLYVRGEGPG